MNVCKILSAMQLEERAAAAAAANEEATGSGEAGPTPDPPVAAAKAAPTAKVFTWQHCWILAHILVLSCFIPATSKVSSALACSSK